MKKGADEIATVLAESGVNRVFSLSGNQIMPLYDAFLEPGIGIVHTRHESSAVFMAEAYAQFSGEPGVALVTAAPGFANALGALYSAKQSETPVILMSGDSPLASDGSGAFQEFDQSRAVQPFVKLTQRVTDISRFREQWSYCWLLAQSGVSGPIHLSLPFDVLNLVADVSHLKMSKISKNNSQESVDDTVRQEDVSAICQFLVQAARPLVLLGPSLCRPNLAGLREHLQQSLDVRPIGMESPRGLNDPVLGDIKSLCRQADRVLLLGKKPDFTIGFGSVEHFCEARFAAVISGEDNKQLVENNIGERCDYRSDASAREFAERLCEYASSTKAAGSVAVKNRKSWNNKLTNCLEQRPVFTRSSTKGALHPMQIAQSVQRAINLLASDDSGGASDAKPVLICDGGEFGQWAQAGVRVAQRMINGPSGAIGGSLACAVGAAAASPGSLIFVMLGDGTTGFYLAELETIAREGVPAIIIVGNDSCWNAEHQIQIDQYGESRAHSCELPAGLRYDEVACALGMAGAQIDSSKALDSALSSAVTRAASKRQATLLNVILEGQKAPKYN